MIWKEKILKGYWYKIGGESKEPRSLVTNTGSGGAILFGEAMEKEGAGDALIQDSISVWLEDEYRKLSSLGVKTNIEPAGVEDNRLNKMGGQTHSEDTNTSQLQKERATTIIGNTALNFGQALDLLKQGKKVARAGWNGKSMFIVRQKGYPEGIACNKNTAEAFGIPEGTIIVVTPYLMMKAADGSLVTGWLASQTDMLADDWSEVEWLDIYEKK